MSTVKTKAVRPSEKLNEFILDYGASCPRRLNSSWIPQWESHIQLWTLLDTISILFWRVCEELQASSIRKRPPNRDMNNEPVECKRMITAQLLNSAYGHRFQHNPPDEAKKFQESKKKKNILQSSLLHTTQESINLLNPVYSILLRIVQRQCGRKSDTHFFQYATRFQTPSPQQKFCRGACGIKGPRSSVRVSEDRVPWGQNDFTSAALATE
jgi:hypothetical protein